MNIIAIGTEQETDSESDSGSGSESGSDSDFSKLKLCYNESAYEACK